MSKLHQETSAPFVERLIFNNRIVVLLLFALLTVFFGYQAAQVKPDTSFEKMIPLKHPYIANMIAHENDLPNLGNSIRIAVEIKDGDIFSTEYMETLKRINDEVFFLPGVDRSNLRSLWTPNVRWTEVTEYGFDGGPVANRPAYLSEADLEELRENVLKSGEIGRLVANNFKSTIIDIPLQEAYPNPENQGELIQLDYGDFSRQLEEKIRSEFQGENPNIQIHIVGFAKKVGDLIDGIIKVVMFFGAALLITFVLLMMFTRCLKSSITTLVCSVIAVVWQLGLLRTLGFGLDPYSILVPFLVFAIGISHGVQIINGMAIEYTNADDSQTAARRAFRALYIPGIVALISDAVGFVTLLLIEIEVIRELGIAASVGVGVIILTNLMLLPILMSYIGISRKAVERNRNMANRPQGLWLGVAKFAHPTVAPISVVLAIIAFGFGIYHGKNVAIGDLDPGAPELRADSRYNLDNQFIIENYSTSSDILVVMVKTPDEMCSAYETMEAIDQLEWRMNNLEGVQSAVSLVTVAKQVIMGNNEGNLKWQTLSRNQDNLNNAISRAPSGMFNSACSLAPVMIFLDDHKADTLKRATAEVEAFAAEYNTEDMQFLLAAGNAGIEAATNVVIEASQTKMLLTVYAVVILMCLITFRSIRAVLCIIIPLALTSVLANALMAFLGIGVKVATLPVIALGVGIGVDYGIYIYSRLETYLRQGLPLQEAYYETLKTTGKAVTFTGFTLAIGVATWIFSAIKFQADMGILLTFMFLWNMFGALWLLPALARFLIRPEKLRS
ncbi:MULTISPECIES: efflux RND transporter permease subunit [Halopseudomonas]|jgi:predicted RND superfamily exporter protein|uniref:SSD domain-containing protein n=1 Tax=Halopseudomonas aestusnigri TaxID=857252 RepID=A0AAQ1JPD2_9GAMM|nr:MULTISPECIES: MMPL family transporter [Halopseudomonas]MAK75108.1 RND transporter [Pseudomonadales bacterium]MEE2800384.1 MMPL family transporter [Pseudomonadota bacterium]HBT58136.1 RND family transporter [Pseudomonas sp.]MAS65900.1 RND transporter [Pseudomonadales bacterium]MAY08601.1 RND transporter [Pseudomonadales bacterium]|tara:strand:+ start:1470 stop:3824 length:2355 start_codon:yes stop_codon:yes gene_type:complete